MHVAKEDPPGSMPISGIEVSIPSMRLVPVVFTGMGSMVFSFVLENLMRYLTDFARS
jgi:hypothetical protein